MFRFSTKRSVLVFGGEGKIIRVRLVCLANLRSCVRRVSGIILSCGFELSVKN